MHTIKYIIIISYGRFILFEQIDKTFYKPAANCASFITSNQRIHAWISAFAEIIYNGEGKRDKHVSWIDKKDNNDNKIVQTEFVVSDKSIGALDYGQDNCMYKIVLYLTTGKIVIQGRDWETFCDEKFNSCMKIVEGHIQKQAGTDKIFSKGR